MATMYSLPFKGDNEIFSIYGRRDLDGDGRYDNTHGGWDIRPPKVNGTVPTAFALWPCDGEIDSEGNFNGLTSANTNASYGIYRRVKTADGSYVILAHMALAAAGTGALVYEGVVAGRYGPNTTGNSGGVHAHWEGRHGGSGTAYRCCPGEMLGIANVKDVTYNREAMNAATVGHLTCERAGYRWRTGAGIDEPLFFDGNNGQKMYALTGVIYRVYAVREVAGTEWCQVTPPMSCIKKGRAPELWVSADCGEYEPIAKAEQAPPTPAQKLDWNSGNSFVVTATGADKARLAALVAELGLPCRSYTEVE